MPEKLLELIGQVQDCGADVTDVVEMIWVENKALADHLIENGVAIPVRCQNCGWWHRHKQGDRSCGVCDKYAASKSENGYCDEPLTEERKYPWKN